MRYSANLWVSDSIDGVMSKYLCPVHHLQQDVFPPSCFRLLFQVTSISDHLLLTNAAVMT